MSAQEELEQLEREMRDKASRLRTPPNEVIDLSPIADWLDKKADHLAAIREAMGKGEPVAEVRGLMGNYGPALKAMTIAAKDFLPVGTLLYAATPPANSAQASMEALLLAGDGLSNAAYNMSQFDVIAADTRAQLRSAAKKWDDALAAHKSEVKR